MPAPVPIDPVKSIRAHFAHTLRVMREMKGLTQAALAKELIVSREAITSYEGNRVTPDPEFFAKLDEFFGTCQVFQGFRHHLQREHIASWFELYLPHEAEAAEIRTFQPNYIPGLLQTEAYMRAVTPAHAINDEGVARRLKRAEVLRGDAPAHLFAILDEPVLMRPVGGNAVMRGQLAHLLEMAQLPNVFIQVVRIRAGWHLGFKGAIVALTKHDHSRVGYVEAQMGGRLIEDSREAAKLSLRFDEIQTLALPAPESLALIRSTMEAMQDEDRMAEE